MGCSPSFVFSFGGSYMAQKMTNRLALTVAVVMVALSGVGFSLLAQNKKFVASPPTKTAPKAQAFVRKKGTKQAKDPVTNGYFFTNIGSFHLVGSKVNGIYLYPPNDGYPYDSNKWSFDS